jgi:hypothetical protein
MRKYPKWMERSVIGIELLLSSYGSMTYAGEAANVPSPPAIEHKAGKTLSMPEGSYKDSKGRLIIPRKMMLLDYESQEESEVSLQELKELCASNPKEISNQRSRKGYFIPLKQEDGFYLISVRIGGSSYFSSPEDISPVLSARQVCRLASGKALRIEIAGFDEEDEAVVNSTWPPKPSLKKVQSYIGYLIQKDYVQEYPPTSLPPP